MADSAPHPSRSFRADFAGDLRLGRRSVLGGAVAAAALAAAARAGIPSPANAQDATPAAGSDASSLPNFLIMWGDDIGIWNISAYNRGMMGYMTPNIDRIAEEGALFQTWYGENSCTAGRAAFLTGQSPVRVGLTKVGLVGAEEGLQAEDPTIAELLKPLGYATGQFGKNHLGDRNEHLPTAHGFDEFFGNLYHLNTHEEPYDPDYPTDPEFAAKFGPRGVIHSFATEEEDTTEDPRFGVVGRQRIEDTGPLDPKRMETIDDEVNQWAEAFVRQAVEDGKPFFCWWNSSRMHVHTHLKPESEGVTGLGVYADGMVETDRNVGRMLDLLDELGVADNTVVMYSTDNGAEEFLWPDGGTTPFRNEKATNWEGGFRVPCMIRWPGVVEPGIVSNEICSHVDMMPTLLAAAGVPDIKEQLLDGVEIDGTTYRVHLDGYNLMPAWSGEAAEWPRREFLYWTDDGDLSALRFDGWKIIFLEQRAEGFKVWSEPYVKLRKPLIENLLMDPFEKMHEVEVGANYEEWEFRHSYLLVPAQAYVAGWLASFAEFPPRQKAASFSLDGVMEQLEASGDR